jgi:hypothetical protein
VPTFWKFVGFKTLEIGFFTIFQLFSLILMDSSPKREDLEPRLRPDFGRKLGCDPQLKIYINQVFLIAMGGSD